MQTGGRSCHAALDAAVDRLIVGRVRIFRLAVEIWRDRDIAGSLHDRSEGHLLIVPFKLNGMGISRKGFVAYGFERHFPAVDVECFFEVGIFPLLEIAYHTLPRATSSGLERHGIVARVERFEKENFDSGSGSSMKLHSGVDNAGIVHHQQRPRGQQIRQLGEGMVRGMALCMHEELAAIPVRKGMLRDPLIRERIVEVLDPNIFYLFDFHTLIREID